MSTTSEELVYAVPGMSCGHCEASIRKELRAVAGVAEIAVDLDAKRVRVNGAALDDAAIVAAIDEAGFDAERV